MEGMNDVIMKILDKPITNEKNVVLSKSKKTKRKREELKEELAAKKERYENKLKEREMAHVIPTRSNADKEVLLKRTASRGVVKLFNAVSAHQKKMSEEMKAAKTESKKDKTVKTLDTKSNFMDLLKKNTKSSKEESKENENESVDTIPNNNKWKVFRDDFMMGGASMKDWDKQDSGGEQSDDDHEESDDDGSE